MLTELHLKSPDDRFIPHKDNTINECAFYFNLEHPFFRGFIYDKPPIASYTKRLDSGIYLTLSHSFEATVETYTSYSCPRLRGFDTDFKPIKASRDNIDYIIHMRPYGVADTVEQITEYYKPLIEDTDNSYVISVVEIDKNDEPSRDGWRWCKWGRYIGTQEITCAYIKNEPVIEKVLCFSIHLIENNENSI